MARGSRAACQAVAEQHLGTGDTSHVAGATWADQGDRSSGVLWGRDRALRAGIDAVIGSEGGARRRNRAANSLVPFVAVFEGGTATNPPLSPADVAVT